jgi:hypothetical protein
MIEFKDRRHRDIHQPWAEWSEEQTLHLIIPYMNPWRWRTRRELTNEAILHFRDAPNIRLHVVEIAFGDRPFEVTVPEDIDSLQLRTQDEIWHKENAINLMIARLPPDWKYAGYVDGDMHFTRYNWGLESIHLLQHYDFIQLFNSFTDLTAPTATSWMGHRPYRHSSSFAWNFTHPKEFLESRKRQIAEAQKGNKVSTATYYYPPKAYKPGEEPKVFPFGFWPGAPGGAWAWRRSGFQVINQLLDTCILGSGDYHMAVGLAGLPDVHQEMQLEIPGYCCAITEWRKHAARLNGNIGCLDNYAIHFWHGNKVHRGYGERPAILRDHSFDPYADIKKDWQGLWQWAGNKPGLRVDTRRFFLSRNEDDVQLIDAKFPLV